MRPATILAAILAFVPFANATAQAPVRPGARVRVTLRPPTCPPVFIRCGSAPRPSVGTLLAWKADSLVMEISGDTLAVLLDTVTGVAVSRERKTNSANGAGFGFLIGSIGGTVLALATYEEPQCGGWFGCIGPTGPELAAVGGFVVGALGGAVAGAIIGRFIKTDRWQEVPLDRIRVSPTLQSNGRFGFGASVRF